jgi:hypothetical protein
MSADGYGIKWFDDTIKRRDKGVFWLVFGWER